MNERRPFTITQVRREDGVWRARLTINGTGYEVDRAFGSWRVTPEDESAGYIDIPHDLAGALQEKVHPIENAERIAREKLAKLDEVKDAEQMLELMDHLEELDARAHGQSKPAGCPNEPECETCPASDDDDVCLEHERPKKLTTPEPALNPFLAGVVLPS